MSAFTGSKKVILMLANRYDGIDLPSADCRMLVVYNRPAGTSLLERYFMDRLEATSVLRDRLRTRVTQAMGRCTRDEGDFSVVVLMGDDLLDWCSNTANVAGLHPELQAEISFGLQNSESRTKEEMVNLCRALLRRTPDWQAAEQEIKSRRNDARKQQDDVTGVLARAAGTEIEHCLDAWSGRHEQAYLKAVEVSEMLQGGSDLLPYRSFWYHQAAASAFQTYKQTGQEALKQAAIDLLGRASATSHWVRWLPNVQAHLSGKAVKTAASQRSQDWFLPLRRLLEELGRIGKKCVLALAEQRANIQATESKRLEKGLEMLGRLLGAEARNFLGGEGMPDGFWLFGDKLALVFEAKIDGADDSGISQKMVRQAGGHEQTVRAIKLLPDNVPCKTVIISQRTVINKLARPHAGEMYYVSHKDIIALFDRASKAFQDVRAASTGNTDEALRERFFERYQQAGLLMEDVAELLQRMRLASLPEKE
jgi:hypothetical protein